MRLLIALTLLAALSGDAVAGKEGFVVGDIFQCRITQSSQLSFNGSSFVGERKADTSGLIQIRVRGSERRPKQPEKLEMTITSPEDGEIYTEEDLVLSAFGDVSKASLYAAYQAPLGNIISIVLHRLKNGTILYTQFKSYQPIVGAPDNFVYQSTSSGTCKTLTPRP